MMTEHEAYLTTFYWLADSWVNDDYLGLEDEYDLDEMNESVEDLLNQMQAGAVGTPSEDDAYWADWQRAVTEVLKPTSDVENTSVTTDDASEVVLPTAVRPERQLENVQAYAAMNAFLQRQSNDEYLRLLGTRAAVQVTGAGWQIWQRHRQSMHPEGAPQTLTMRQLRAVVWVFISRYNLKDDPFDIYSLLNALESWQVSGDAKLDAQWQQIVDASDVDPQAITLVEGLSLALQLLDQAEWDGDLTAKVTLQNKLTQRTLDGKLNEETERNWVYAWQHWDLAQPANTEQWARHFDAEFNDEDDDDESQEQPAWKLGASYSTVLIAVRLIAYGMFRPESVPGLAAVGMSNQALGAMVSVGIVLVAWLITAIVITIGIWGWRQIRRLIF